MWLKPVKLHKKSRGYTLTEMMITVSIMAIALGLAAPSFSNFIENNRMTTVANKLVSSIILARNEAVSRRGTVTITGDDDSWQVITVPLTTGIAPTTLASYTMEQGMLLRINDNSIDSITFTPDGFRDLSGNTSPFFFTVCAADTTNTRIVNVSAAGTTLVSKGTGGCP